VQPWTPLVEALQAVWDRAAGFLETGSPLALAKLGFRLLSLTNSVALYLFPVLVSVVAGHFLMTRTVKRSEQAIVVALLGWGLLSLAKALKNPVLYYWMAGTTPLLFILVFLLQWAWQRQRRGLKPVLVGTVIVLALSVPTGVAVSAFRVATIHEELRGPHGSVFVQGRMEAQDIRRIFAFIMEKTSAHEYVFVDPFQFPPVYAMTARRNPSYYDAVQVLYAGRFAGLPTEEEEQRVCREVLSHETRVVVTEKHTAAGEFEVLQRCIEANFAFAEQVGRYTVYVARDP